MVGLALLLNRAFRPPNVGGRESREAYSAWEYELGRGIVRDYLEPAGDLGGKKVLDVGCGLGGKTVAYREGGAAGVVGTDILPGNVASSAAFAGSRGAGEAVAFMVSDAGMLPMADAVFDTVVANDAMEHFAEPERAVAEMSRVTAAGGAIWIFFTPHYSPLGSHLYDYVYTPWCHLLFTRRTLEGAVGRVLAERMVGEPQQTVEVRLREIMRSYDEDLNHMSVRRFLGIVRGRRELRVAYLELRPARFGFLRPATRVPLVREFVTGFVVCRLEKRS